MDRAFNLEGWDSSMGTEQIVVICLFSWIPILAFTHMIKTVHNLHEGGKATKRKGKQGDHLEASVEHLRAELEQLRNTSTGFDLSFDKRLSELELQTRLAKLKDAPTSQSHHR